MPVKSLVKDTATPPRHDGAPAFDGASVPEAPPLRTDPAYAEVEDRVLGFEAEARDLDRRAEAMQVPRPKTNLDRAADDLWKGVPPPPAAPAFAGESAGLAELRRRKALVEAAAAKGRGELNRMRGEAGRRWAADTLAWRRELAREQARHAAALLRLAALDRLCIDRATGEYEHAVGGVSPTRPLFVGDRPDENGPFGCWGRGLIEAGVLDASDRALDGTGVGPADREAQAGADAALLAAEAFRRDRQAATEAAAAEARRKAHEEYYGAGQKRSRAVAERYEPAGSW